MSTSLAESRKSAISVREEIKPGFPQRFAAQRRRKRRRQIAISTKSNKQKSGGFLSALLACFFSFYLLLTLDLFSLFFIPLYMFLTIDPHTKRRKRMNRNAHYARCENASSLSGWTRGKHAFPLPEGSVFVWKMALSFSRVHKMQSQANRTLPNVSARTLSQKPLVLAAIIQNLHQPKCSEDFQLWFQHKRSCILIDEMVC
jgi:hypothetical protein